MCGNPEVSYKKLYPTFIRTFAIDTKLTPSLLSLLKYFNWKRVAIIYENVTKWIEMKNNMVKRLRAKGITVAQELLTHPSALYRPENHTDNYRSIMRKIKQEARSKYCKEGLRRGDEFSVISLNFSTISYHYGHSSAIS